MHKIIFFSRKKKLFKKICLPTLPTISDLLHETLISLSGLTTILDKNLYMSHYISICYCTGPSSDYAVTHVQNKISNIQGRSPHVVKVA